MTVPLLAYRIAGQGSFFYFFLERYVLRFVSTFESPSVIHFIFLTLAHRFVYALRMALCVTQCAYVGYVLCVDTDSRVVYPPCVGDAALVWV
jgi:hypothetical protein